MRKFALLLLVVVCAAGAVAERVDTVSQQKAAIGRYLVASRKAQFEFSREGLGEIKAAGINAILDRVDNGQRMTAQQYLDIEREVGAKLPVGYIAKVDISTLVGMPKHKLAYLDAERHWQRKYNRKGSDQERDSFMCDRALEILGDYATGVIEH